MVANDGQRWQTTVNYHRTTGQRWLIGAGVEATSASTLAGRTHLLTWQPRVTMWHPRATDVDIVELPKPDSNLGPPEKLVPKNVVIGSVGEPGIVGTRGSSLRHVDEGSQAFVVVDNDLGCLVGRVVNDVQTGNINSVDVSSVANVVDNVNDTFDVYGFSQIDTLLNESRKRGPPLEYKYIGKCEHSCEHYGDRFWYEEHIPGVHTIAAKRSSLYGEYKGLQPDVQYDIPSNSDLRRDIVEGLIELLDNHNALVQLFRTPCEKLLDSEVPPFKVRLFNVVGAREYELPTGDMLGAIIYEPGPDTNMDFDIVIDRRIGQPQRVSKLHPSYMALQFPLLFVYGEDGYSKDMKMFPLLFVYGEDGYSKDMKMVRVSGMSSDEDRRLTMKAYYSYMLHDRVNSFNYLSKTERLFQQYMVTAFCAVEQSRIDFIRAHQNDIRNEYLSDIYDVIRRGDSDGSDCGGRLILPQSFTGGPRYMYAHYLDSLVICRVHGNPSYFITFTCNVKWPEITEYMDDFRGVTTADIADIVDRVFEMKIHQFMKYLRDIKPFGKVLAIVYTVEFQKRGLPHCHTLLLIDENSHVHNYEDIDNYISAELSSKEIDPEGHMVVSEFMIHVPCGTVCPAAACMKNGPRCIPNLHIDPSELENYTKYEFEACLNHCSRLLADFGIPMPPEDLMLFLTNRLLMEEKSYNRDLMAIKRDKLIDKLNDCQRNIFNLIIHVVAPRTQELIFVYGHGGTGNTFLWKTIIYTLLGVPDVSDPENTSWLEIPTKFQIPNDENSLTKLIEFIYDKDTLLHPNAKYLQDKAIVCLKNDTTDVINAKIMDMLPGCATTYISNDEAIPHGHNGGGVELLYPIEYLNTLNFAGIPPHKLKLKIELSSTAYDKTIEAIVYHKWTSKTTRTRTPTKFCCILIDRQGTPIQANMGLLDAEYFDQLLQLQKAYQFTGFSCEPMYK
nr:DNA helicase [Tanacetum cinerariifolium]